MNQMYPREAAASIVTTITTQAPPSHRTPFTDDCTPDSQVVTLSRVADSVTSAIAELRSTLLAGEMRLRYTRDTREIAARRRAAHALCLCWPDTWRVRMHVVVAAGLAAPLTLADALRIVGALRRLPPPHALGETSLRMLYLRNRTIHLAQALLSCRLL